MASAFLVLALILVILGLYAGVWIHEGTHWLIGKKHGSGLWFTWWICIVPTGVRHRNLGKIPDGCLRVSGGSPLLYLLVAILTIAYIFSNQSAVARNLAIIFGVIPFGIAGVMLTKSDVWALWDPRKYRKQAKNDELSARWGYTLLARLLVRRLLKSR